MINNNNFILFSITFVIVSFTVGFAIADSDFVTKDAKDELIENNVRFVNSGNKVPTIMDSTNETGGFINISGDGKTIIFGTPKLTNLNQEVTVKYYVENYSKYDIKIGKLKCNIKETTDTGINILEYVSIIPSNNYNKRILTSNSTTNSYDTIKIKLIKPYTGNDVSFNILCNMNVTEEA